MRIGILSFWGVPNYGSFLQSYALKQKVSQLIPDAQVEVIPYLNPCHYNMYYRLFPPCSARSMLRLGFYKSVLERVKNSRSTQEINRIFMNHYTALAGRSQISGETLEQELYDVVILGRDIIWDYTVSFFGKDLYLFGNNLRAEKIISYAASFGTAPLDADLPNYVRSGIEGLSSISVRDEKSHDIIAKNFSLNPLIVPDPTVLWDFNNDINFCQENPFGDYIAVYGSTFPNELISQAIAYAERNRLKLICLDSGGDAFDWCDECIGQEKMDPFTWAAMIKNSKAVMTCTFHGLMFSLLFKKRIAFYMTDFIMPKISSIMPQLGIEDPLLHLQRFDDKIEWDWDYSKLDKKMAELCDIGTTFLKNGL